MLRVVRSTFSLVLVAAAALLLSGYGPDGTRDADCSMSPATPSLELVYRLDAGMKVATPSIRDEAMAVICERLRRVVGSDGQVEALGEKRIRVLLPQARGDGARRASEQLGVTGRLVFYDWEANLIGRERRIGGHPGRTPPAGALKRAKREWRAAGRDVDDPANLQLILAGALPTAHDAASLAAALKRQIGVGTRIVSEQSVDSLGRIDETARPGWFVLKERPALTGADIVNVRQEFGAFNEPNVTFGFTDKGRLAFERVTGTIAEKGQARARGPVTQAEVEVLSGHLALVVDNEVKTRPIINFASYPQGIDGRSGAQVSGGFSSVREARELAAMLKIGALPVGLVLIRQRTR
ncbi:MAG TPA: hypothetical protein VEW07_10635 [Solirubrobacterales bacterium]|nr:hypothetical protein [Solirubrobacterales bacterium]